MSFWGAKVAPGEVAKVAVPAGEVLHLSQACLDPGAAPGSSSRVVVEQKGSSFAVAILKVGGQECCALDLFIDLSEATLKNVGKATVHLTGYFESEDMDDDGDEAPAKASPKVVAKSSPKAEVKASPKAALKTTPKADTKKVEEEDDDEDEDEEEEEEEEGEEPAKPAAKAAAKEKAKAKAAPAKAAADDDDDEDEEEEEESEEETAADESGDAEEEAEEEEEEEEAEDEDTASSDVEVVKQE
mmetsp:Transcript_48696/g.138209  ORF Transcript_48696/g.138209 Transcript_48696/m.138209 type:complete len:243 (+) Transcript_48696:101-829(+)